MVDSVKTATKEATAFMTLSVPISIKLWLGARAERNARSLNREAKVILAKAMAEELKVAA